MRAAHLRRSPAMLAVASLFVVATASDVAGQAPKHSEAVSAKTPDGDPDLRGIWEVHGTANWNIEGHPAQRGIAASGSIVVDPADGKIPYRPEARTKREAMQSADDPQAKCYMAGVPRATYTPGPFQIFQTSGMAIIVYQDLHTYRYIPTTSLPQITGADFWMGSSRGRWEGDTLVVETVSFNDQTWFDKVGNFHSDQLHVIERYSLAGRNKLTYEARIEDPKTFTQPWTIRLTADRHTEPGFRLLEDECLKSESGALYHTAPPTRREPQ